MRNLFDLIEPLFCLPAVGVGCCGISPWETAFVDKGCIPATFTLHSHAQLVGMDTLPVGRVLVLVLSLCLWLVFGV
jgi:hypothetical protein